MPSTTPDFSTVTAGCSSGVGSRRRRPAGLVEGRGCPRPRALRRQRRRALRRSGFGQASSNDAGGASAGSGGGGAAGGLGRRSATADPAATARWFAPARARAPCATTRKTTDCASAWPPARLGGVGSGGASPRGRSREAASSCQGGGDGGAAAGWCRRHSARPVAVDGKPPSAGAGCARRPGGSTGRTATSPRGCGDTGAKPPRDGLQFPDRHPEPEHDRAGANRHHAGEDQRIAETEFLDRDSEADRQQARQNKANPGDQHANHHRTHPPAAPEMLASRQRHDTVIMCASPTGNCAQGSSKISAPATACPSIRAPAIQLAFSPVRISTAYQLLPICCVASGNYATIPNYLEMELRYMDAGE